LTFVSPSHYGSTNDNIEQELVALGYSKEATSENDKSIFTYTKDAVMIRKTSNIQKDNSSTYGAFKIYDVYQLVILK